MTAPDRGESDEVYTSPHGTAVYTIGHSNLSTDALVRLLAVMDIEVVADVRSSPYSRFAPQFNAPSLRWALDAATIQYVPMGEQLGGRPSRTDMYDVEGHVLYRRLASDPNFVQGIDRLIEGSKEYRVAVMCAEEDPMDCHRRLLVGRVLSDRGVRVLHIRSSGAVDGEDLVREAEVALHPERSQLRAFENEEVAWRSIRSVSRGTPLPTFSRRFGARKSGGSLTSG